MGFNYWQGRATSSVRFPAAPGKGEPSTYAGFSNAPSLPLTEQCQTAKDPGMKVAVIRSRQLIRTESEPWTATDRDCNRGYGGG